MRSLILISAAFAMVACTPTTDVQNAGDNVLNQVVSGDASQSDCGVTSNTLADEKVLFAVETAYNVPADAYVRALGTNKLSASVKAAIQPKLVKLYDYLKLARQAYAAGDGCSLARYRDLAETLSSEVKAQL